MMQELTTIGKVRMNFKHYAGLDLYSDGAVENELLDIVRMHRPEEYQTVIEQKGSWPIFYHLSRERSNIVEWIPMNGHALPKGRRGHLLRPLAQAQ